jgi:hypothetical protein
MPITIKAPMDEDQQEDPGDEMLPREVGAVFMSHMTQAAV